MNDQSDCQCCGKCCLNMHQYIVIESGRNEGRMLCRCTLTNEQFLVTLSGEDMRRMNDISFHVKNPKACPFLAKSAGDTFSCIIYPLRPGHCRSFHCAHSQNNQD